MLVTAPTFSHGTPSTILYPGSNEIIYITKNKYMHLPAHLLLATVATTAAVVGEATASTFRVKPEFPASEADPNTHTYATLLFDEAGGALPAGAKFLRLVVDSPGPLGAVAAPLEWCVYIPSPSDSLPVVD